MIKYLKFKRIGFDGPNSITIDGVMYPLLAIEKVYKSRHELLNARAIFSVDKMLKRIGHPNHGWLATASAELVPIDRDDPTSEMCWEVEDLLWSRRWLDSLKEDKL